MIGKVDEEFGKPVESIMRCEDFKSNFARRLSNRYTSKTAAAKDNALKLLPNSDLPNNAPERIEAPQLSKSVIEESEVTRPPDKVNSDLRTTEVSALNLEVETLRWQLSQTEANRQMHIALLRQIVAFLSRVKEHIEGQKPVESPPKVTPRVPRSFNVADLPRSRSVVHVNKNLELSLSPNKKTNTRKISKSISNVNGFRDCPGAWSSSKMSLTSETESNQKLSEEMSRLITLAGTVLSTNIPDLACNNSEETPIVIRKTPEQEKSSSTLNLIEEDAACGLKPEDTGAKAETNVSIQDFILSPCELENDFADIKIDHETIKTNVKTNRLIDKRNEYNAASYVEDESGFSSMSSFQEIGIPIISIIPPSPCKDGYGDEINILDDNAKWRDEAVNLDEQAVKVFWV